MFSKFFIDRPIFATVLALLIVVAGLVTLGILPIAQYPDITPPTVQVSAVREIGKLTLPAGACVLRLQIEQAGDKLEIQKIIVK